MTETKMTNKLTLKVMVDQNNPNAEIYLLDFLEKIDRYNLVKDGTIQVFVGK